MTIDPQTGAFAGYASGENLGWISLKGGSGATVYGVATVFGSCQIYLRLCLRQKVFSDYFGFGLLMGAVPSPGGWTWILPGAGGCGFSASLVFPWASFFNCS